MFNAGQGRIYASAANVKDILNLSGKEVASYGSVPIPGTETTPSTNSAPAASFDSKNISNLKRSGTGGAENVATATSGEYVSNLTQMLIDS